MKFLLLTFSCFFISFCFGQEVENVKIEIDSTKLSIPTKAAIFSTILPGAGQIFNHIQMPKGKKKAFWKVPLIYAGLGATSSFFIYNQKMQLSLKNEYNNRQNNQPLNPDFELYDDQGVLTLYEQHIRRRDLSILGFVGVYGIQIVDALIEAHFIDFDVSKDLTMRINPYILGFNNVGVNLKLNFR